MSLHDRLLADTAEARAAFLSIPLIGRALRGEVSRPLYVAFLSQAYHHVRHTCPLLALAAARTRDAAYRTALFGYIAEESGHEAWILDDIRAVGGDPEAAALAPPRLPCRLMVAYAYHAVDWVSPYALLGMVHVLEGMSVRLAGSLADVLRSALSLRDGRGLRYLRSHGALDVGHVDLFRRVVDAIEDPSAGPPIVDAANVFYRLYGDILRDLGTLSMEPSHAA